MYVSVVRYVMMGVSLSLIRYVMIGISVIPYVMCMMCVSYTVRHDSCMMCHDKRVSYTMRHYVYMPAWLGRRNQGQCLNGVPVSISQCWIYRADASSNASWDAIPYKFIPSYSLFKQLVATCSRKAIISTMTQKRWGMPRMIGVFVRHTNAFHCLSGVNPSARSRWFYITTAREKDSIPLSLVRTELLLAALSELLWIG